MMLHNTRQTYGLVAQLLHWVTALLILVLIPLGVFMHELPISTSQEVAYKSWYYSLHKTLGVSVFAIAIIRVFWAFIQPKPGALNSERRIESFVASTVHWTLYGAIIAMPLTGWLHHSALEGFAPIWWPFGQDLPFVPKDADLASAFGTAHFLTGLLIVLSLLLHIAGAMKHALIDRDMTLKRMVPGREVQLDASMLGKSKSLAPMGIAASCFVLIAALSLGGVLKHDHEETSNPEPAITPETSVELASDTAAPSVPRWMFDLSKSTLGIAITQSGNLVPGEFATWNADIAFDPENLEASRIHVIIDIGSLKLGGVTDKALDQPFLNVKQFPKAEFVSEKIILVEAGRYEAQGKLNLIGVSKPFVLPFSLEIRDNRALATANAIIQRLDFGIGEKGFQTDGTVGFDVQVNVTLEADRQP